MDNNQLCEKLQYKFRNRGINGLFSAAQPSTHYTGQPAGASAAFSGHRAQSAQRAQNTQNTGKAQSARSGQRTQNIHNVRGAQNPQNARNAQPSSFASDGKYGAAYARAARIRDYSECFNAAAYERRRGIHGEKRIKIKKSFGETVRKGFSSFFSREETDFSERQVKSTPIPKGFIAALALCTVLLMVVLNTFSAYSEISSEVKQLKKEQTELMQERDKASNLLSVRDDIRDIETYATENIGMVKSDYVETRHVSVAGGERIEIISNTEEEAPTGIFSTMLSAMGSYREKLLEYID